MYNSFLSKRLFSFSIYNTNVKFNMNNSFLSKNVFFKNIVFLYKGENLVFTIASYLKEKVPA